LFISFPHNVKLTGSTYATFEYYCWFGFYFLISYIAIYLTTFPVPSSAHPPIQNPVSSIKNRVSADADDIMAGIALKKQEKIFTPWDLPYGTFRYFLTGSSSRFSHQVSRI